MTLAQLAQDAVNVQDACNLSGVARSLYEACATLRENGVVGTDAVNTHPITRLFAYKLATLAGMFPTLDDGAYASAYKACVELALEGVRA